MSEFALDAVRREFLAELKTISAANGYNNTVRGVHEDLSLVCTSFPSLTFVAMPDFTIEATDSALSTYDMYVPFAILCEIEAPMQNSSFSPLTKAQDYLLHDVLKCFMVLNKKYINRLSDGPKWNVMNKPAIRVTPVYPSAEKVGLFKVSGQIHIRNLDNTLT